MKVIIAGSRTVTDSAALREAIARSGFEVSEVISGGARGVDRLGEEWARENDVSLVVVPAEWEIHGKAAGMIRNRKMAEAADALLALWDFESRGTFNMIQEAVKRRLKVFAFPVKP